MGEERRRKPQLWAFWHPHRASSNQTPVDSSNGCGTRARGGFRSAFCLKSADPWRGCFHPVEFSVGMASERPFGRRRQHGSQAVRITAPVSTVARLRRALGNQVIEYRNPFRNSAIARKRSWEVTTVPSFGPNSPPDHNGKKKASISLSSPFARLLGKSSPISGRFGKTGRFIPLVTAVLPNQFAKEWDF